MQQRQWVLLKTRRKFQSTCNRLVAHEGLAPSEDSRTAGISFVQVAQLSLNCSSLPFFANMAQQPPSPNNAIACWSRLCLRVCVGSGGVGCVFTILTSVTDSFPWVLSLLLLTCKAARAVDHLSVHLKVPRKSLVPSMLGRSFPDKQFSR